jgi:hypothetical protein
MTSIATLKRIQAQKLSELILAEAEGKGETDTSFAVIDVRDDGKLSFFHNGIYPLFTVPSSSSFIY